VIGRLEEWISQVATISGFGVGGAARGGAAAFICTSGEREIIASPFCVNATFPCTASSMVLLAETVFFPTNDPFYENGCRHRSKSPRMARPKSSRITLKKPGCNPGA
jgi:hypothetical protein